MLVDPLFLVENRYLPLFLNVAPYPQLNVVFYQHIYACEFISFNPSRLLWSKNSKYFCFSFE
jgi:hypothetical protein